MNFSKIPIKTDERIALNLRSLFEKYSYKKYKVSKFEEYDFYASNKNFLGSDNILTFSGIDGKLMALKPDITLSIIKNANDSYDVANRLYYHENVYRHLKGADEYKEIMQVGLEYLGNIDEYATLEVLQLAQKSMESISPKYILDMSHMGYLGGLLKDIPILPNSKKKILKAVSEKNPHGIELSCNKYGVDPKYTRKFIAISDLYGDVAKVLPIARNLCVNKKMHNALDELMFIYEALRIVSPDSQIHLDFSMVSDMAYYNGITFQGYVPGISRSVLSGGRYDNLVRKMDKNFSALGFAVYLDLFENWEDLSSIYDADNLLLYDENTNAKYLLVHSNELTQNGESVIVHKGDYSEIKCKKVWKITDRGLECIETND